MTFVVQILIRDSYMVSSYLDISSLCDCKREHRMTVGAPLIDPMAMCCYGEAVSNQSLRIHVHEEPKTTSVRNGQRSSITLRPKLKMTALSTLAF